ncbi:MAG TPA: hypothetical protein PKD54_11860 [Pirellulaceae bacterium]|nr:hypothetical protein [Pirellulaceae bacterium]
MKNEKWDLELQRLVDGELTRPRIRDMLGQAESQPDLWRELALAFVEQQVIGRELTAFVGESPDCEAALQHADDIGTEVATETRSMSSARFAPWGITRNGHLGWLAAVASFVLMLPLGFWLGSQRVQPPQLSYQEGPKLTNPIATLPVVESTVDDHQPSSIDRIERALVPYKMQLVSGDGEPLMGEEIPLIPQTLAVEMGIQLRRIEIPEDVQYEWRQGGFELQPRVRYLVGRLGDGREVVVPVQDVTLVAYGQ